MTWATDRDAALANATTAGTALATALTSMKTALTTAQNGSGTGADVPGGMPVWEETIGVTIKNAILAANVAPSDLKRILRFAIGQFR